MIIISFFIDLGDVTSVSHFSVRFCPNCIVLEESYNFLGFFLFCLFVCFSLLSYIFNSSWFVLISFTALLIGLNSKKTKSQGVEVKYLKHKWERKSRLKQRNFGHTEAKQLSIIILMYNTYHLVWLSRAVNFLSSTYSGFQHCSNIFAVILLIFYIYELFFNYVFKKNRELKKL